MIAAAIWRKVPAPKAPETILEHALRELGKRNDGKEIASAVISSGILDQVFGIDVTASHQAAKTIKDWLRRQELADPETGIVVP